MRYRFWLILLLSSCARSPTKPLPTHALYGGVLPTRNGFVFFRQHTAKPGVPISEADRRARAWFRSSGRALNATEQKPIRQKSDLLFLASLPAHPLPADPAGNVQTLPPLRFLVTVDNTGDSTRVFASNFEVMDRRGRYQVIEKQRVNAGPMWVSLWLADVDAAVTVMLASLTDQITHPANQ